MRIIFKNFKNKGVSLVEVVIAAGIIATISVVVFSTYALMNKYAIQNTALIQASMLAEEGVEGLRVMRDFGWTANIASLNAGTTYRIAWNGGRYAATTSTAFIDGKFDRTFTLSNVNRDANFNIVSSGGTQDTGSKKAVVTVSWRQGNATTSKSIESYIYNSFSN